MSSTILRLSRSIILIHHLTLMYHIHHLDFSKITDRKVLDLQLFEKRFLTGWNLFAQVIYLIISLVNDIIQNETFDIITEKMQMKLRRFQEFIFVTIIFPVTLSVFTLFWTLWNIDREFVLPAAADVIITPVINHGIHSLIIILLITEILFFEMENKFSYSFSIKILTAFVLIYNCVIIETYLEYGRWIYHIFGCISLFQKIVFVGFIYILGIFYHLMGRKVIEYRWRHKHTMQKTLEPNNNFNAYCVKKVE